MAENEYLDSSKARRWQSVAQAIRDGCSDEEIADRIQECFYKTLRAIAKDLPLSDMFAAAAHDPAELARMCDGIKGGHDVKDFLLQAAQTRFGTETMLETFLNDSLNNCLYDVPYLAAELDGGITISEARAAVQSAAGSLRSDIQRMALKLAENPSWNFRRIGNRRSENSQRDRTKEMLGESLIAGFTK
jgi:hypothetical protein